MVDIISEERRSWNMSRIRSKNTKPEMVVRSMLHRMGFRFRLHDRKLPGNPDIVLPRYKTVIFVHGCFWHRHPGCSYTYTPKSRVEFWEVKFQKNINNDQGNIRVLRESGWQVKVIWECETRDIYTLAETIVAFLKVRVKLE